MRTKGGQGGQEGANREPRGAHQQPVGAKAGQKGQEADHEKHRKSLISKVAPARPPQSFFFEIGVVMKKKNFRNHENSLENCVFRGS